MTEPTTPDPTTPADEELTDEELAALKGAVDGERFGRALVALQTYAKAFSEAARAAIAELSGALAQMPHAPAVADAERLSGPGEGRSSQTPQTAVGVTGAVRDTTGGEK